MISIIVPIFNSEKYLQDCIESIASQNHKDWELLLIDDGSTDSSGEIAMNWGRRDDRVRYYKKENGGVSSARNFGLDKANGEYVTFFDSDDIIHPAMLSMLSANIERFDISACLTTRFMNNPVIGPLSNTTEHIELPSKTDIYLKFSSYNLLHPPYAKIYKRSIIDEWNIRFNENLKLGEDLCFNLDYLEHASSAVIIPEQLYYYRDTAGSLSKSIKGDYADIQMNLFDRKYSFVKKFNIPFDFHSIASGIVLDIFLSECKCSGTIEEKQSAIDKLKSHQLIKLCRLTTSGKSFIVITAIKLLPTKLLIRLFK